MIDGVKDHCGSPTEGPLIVDYPNEFVESALDALRYCAFAAATNAL
jgi:hypothetical protein